MVVRLVKETVNTVKSNEKITILNCNVSEVISIEGLIGDGTEKDPIRKSKLYFTFDGAFIGEIIV